MRSISITFPITLLVTILAAWIFSSTLVHAVLYAPEGALALPAHAAQKPAFSAAVNKTLPAHLIIPSLKINAAIQEVGLNALGNIMAPSNFTDVAWYDQGTIPGKVGSAVIDGHVDNGLGLAGVFKHLSDIKVGDDVYVQTNAGTKLHFVVTDIETYSYQNVPTQKLFAQDGSAHLNLITCEGTWVKSGDTYDHRLVVYTHLVSS
jgi:LPXTG-site transpeptidase (sortase) family protein